MDDPQRRELHAFVPVSTQFGSALAGTYNDAARGRHARTRPRGGRSGASPTTADLFNRVGTTNEAVLEKQLRARVAATTSASTPPTWPRSRWWTTRRMLDLAGLDWRDPHRGDDHASTTTGPTAGVMCFWIFALLALAGAFTATARGGRRWCVWAVPVLMFLSVVFLVVETPRYRTPIDPFIVLLAALALVAAGAGCSAGRRGGGAVPAS